MQSTLALYNLLQYAGRTRKQVQLYVRPIGLHIPNRQGIVTDDGLYVVTGYRLDRDKRQPAEIRINGWLDSFWRAMESAGWRIGAKHRLAQGEVLWTLTPMAAEHPSERMVPERDALLDYVERIRPMAGERAQRALEIATCGKARRLAPGQDGKDRWAVESSSTGSYQVSIEGGYCTCPDADNGAPTWMDAPLCKHRLAVMYIYRWEQDRHKQYANPTPAPEGERCSLNGTPQPPYVTVMPPQTSKEGWRWVHVRPDGQLNLYSRQRFLCVDEAMRVARIVADAKAVPLYLNGYAQDDGESVATEGKDSMSTAQSISAIPAVQRSRRR